MRISDQSAAIKLAMCDDIGDRSYDFADVAAILVQMLTKFPSVGVYPSFLYYHLNIVTSRSTYLYIEKLSVVNGRICHTPPISV